MSDGVGFLTSYHYSSVDRTDVVKRFFAGAARKNFLNVQDIKRSRHYMKCV